MELREISYVLAVMRRLNFTRASEDLRVAQPALSSQVRKLEAELGVRLLDRTSRHVSITSAGLAFAERAKRIQAEVDALTREMGEYAGAVRGQVRIGGWYITNPELPELLAGFAREHPRVELTVREETSEEMLRMLRSAELDVALPVLRDGLDLSDVEYDVYRTEPFVLVTSRTSRFASRRVVRIDELVDTPLVVFKSGSSLQELVAEAFSAAGLLPRVALETAQLSTARAYASTGLGVAIIPGSVAKTDGPPVAVVPITPAVERVSVIAWRRTLAHSPVTEAFISYLRSRLTPTP
jgi:DNA-binding transcriptional LysR family regulator